MLLVAVTLDRADLDGAALDHGGRYTWGVGRRIGVCMAE